MAHQERRRAERITLTPPLPALLENRDVRIIDIGPLGLRVEHRDPIAPTASARLTFQWGGQDIALDCMVARSEGIAPSDGTNIFHTGLAFHQPEEPIQRMLSALEQREEIERLHRLVEASKLINSSIEADALFDSILKVARHELGVDRGTLYFVDDKTGEIWSKIAGDMNGRQIRLPIGKGLAGSVAATGEPILLHDAYSDERFDRSLDQASGYRTRSMLCAPIKNRSGRVVGVLQLLNKLHGSFGERDLRFLDAISDHMAIGMENATMHLELLEKQRMQRELQLGREIQNGLFPTPPGDVDQTELAAQSIACFEVGGDYYDFLEFPNGDLGVVIADVSGKGVGAALIMSSIQAALRVAAPIENDMAMLVSRLNALLYRAARGRKYVTFFFGRYSPATGQLRYVNAGHNPPLLIDGGGVKKLASTGKPIGILPDSRFYEAETELQPGATLFLYTDGLNEAANPEEEEFGMERLERVVVDAAGGSLAALPALVLDAVTKFENGAHATDDKTIVALRRAT